MRPRTEPAPPGRDAGDEDEGDGRQRQGGRVGRPSAQRVGQAEDRRRRPRTRRRGIRCVVGMRMIWEQAGPGADPARWRAAELPVLLLVLGAAVATQVAQVRFPIPTSA